MAAFRLLFVAALVALPLWVASTVPVEACIYSLASAVEQSDIIVTGKSTGVQVVRDPTHEEYGSAIVTFAVDSYLKGTGPTGVLIDYRIHHSDGGILYGPGCGESLMPQGEVLAFLTKTESRYSVVRMTYFSPANSNTLTQIEGQVGHAGLPPTGSGPPSHSDARLPLITASALATVGLAANAAYALRRS